MSVPVRYSAAANLNAIIAERRSGLLNSSQQEGEQQYQHQQPQQRCEQELFHHQQYSKHYKNKKQHKHNNNHHSSFNHNHNNNTCLKRKKIGQHNLEKQQQLMQQQLMQQQRSSMSTSSVLLTARANNMPTKSLVKATATVTSSSSAAAEAAQASSSPTKINNNTSSHHLHNQHTSPMKSTATATLATLSAIEAAATEMNGAGIGAGVVQAGAVDNVGIIDESATMQTSEEWLTDDEGRYGLPGAAGLDYQKYELELQQQLQQHQQQQKIPAINNNNNNNNNNNYENNINNNDQTMDPEPSSSGNANSENGRKFESELIALTSDELYNTLKEYDALQDKYHTVLLLPKESRREVTAGGRDGSAYVLRCLKMWYELPSDVLFNAMSLVDRFLDRMAVKPKHMACMSVASFHLAIKQLDLKPIPAEDLVTISQCGCTAGDLERMAGVIASKLGVQMGHAPITSVSYLRIYYALFYNLAKDIGGQFFEFYKQLIKLEELENRLEILLCDVKTTVISPSTLALVLICLHLDFHIKESYTRGSPELKHVFEYILFLQQYMRIPDHVFTCGFSTVSGILSHYNGQNKQPYKQRLVWKLSSRTLRVLRPINRFSSDLPTIQEGISNAMDDGLRSRTDSLSSEEEEDWPTSPIIPIFEQC